MKPTTGGYFEGILQLRGPTPEIIAWVKEQVKKDGKAAITKEKPVSGGVDLYFNDQHYLQNLGNKLKNKFSGILKISRRLHTVHKMTSKLLYRVNVLFKPYPFRRGDIIEHHGERLEIQRVEKAVHVKDVETGEKKKISLDALLRAYG